MAAKRGDYADEVAFLLRCGESAQRIPNRLGIRPDSLARTLHRNGHTDLARQFWRIAQSERRVAP